MAYSNKYKFVDQDWDICAVNFEHRHLYLEFIIDENCPKEDLFHHMLYVLCGSIISDVISYQITYDLNNDKIIYLEPEALKNKETIIKAYNDLNTLYSELSQVNNESIKNLCNAVKSKLLCESVDFDYHFWFEGGWKV